VVLAAQNSYYEKFLNEIYNKVQIYMIFYDTSIDNSGSLVSHAALLEALKNNDLEAGINAVIKDNSIAINDIGSTRC
jgi:DNA-binding FadR family transcriptional regulator